MQNKYSTADQLRGLQYEGGKIVEAFEMHNYAGYLIMIRETDENGETIRSTPLVISYISARDLIHVEKSEDVENG